MCIFFVSFVNALLVIDLSVFARTVYTIRSI